MDKGRLQQFKKFFSAASFLGLFVAIFFSAFFFTTTPVEALGTPPTIISYQAKLLGATNSPVTSATNMSFVLYDSLTMGNALYTAAGTLATPTTMSITPSSGVFAVNLGDTGTNPLNTDIFKNNGSVYLEVSVGGETLTPRKQITSAPYAINSAYLNGYGAATASTSAYIPLSDSQGNFQFSNITSTGFVTFATTTVASSTITALNGTTANFVSLFANSLSLASTFGVSGLSTLSSGFISSASSSISRLQVSGALNASSTLLVNGAATLNSTLGVTGLTTLTNGLIANASSSFTGPVTVSGPFNASSTFFSSGDAYIATSTITNANITTLAVTSCTGCAAGSALLSANQTFTASNTFSVTTTFMGGVGIGTTTPAAKLAISGGAILAEGTFGGSGATPTDGAGTRLMWIPNKAAFRAGYVNGTQWDASNIGIYSAAFGENNTVSGDRAFGAGTGNTVSQTGSVAFGGSNSVSVTYSGAFGLSNIVNGGGAGYAFGLNNTVSGASSAFALGSANTSSGGTGSAAIGDTNTAAGTSAIALGSHVIVSGNNSVGIGLDTNTRTLARNNTLAILGGNVGIGTVTPGYLLSVSGTMAVTATSTFTTTTMTSSTIESGNITSLFANTATITTLTVGSCSGCSNGGASLTANQAFTGLNTFSATTTLATTTVAGNFVPSIDNLYDIGASSTRWRYLNLRGGVQIADGTTTSTLQNGSLILGQTTGYNVGKLYIDTSGNISTSGSIQFAGNLLPQGAPTIVTTTLTTTTLDATAGAGGATNGSHRNLAVAIGLDGLPVVAVHNNSSGVVSVIKCGNTKCTAGNVTSNIGSNSYSNISMVIGRDGFPVVSFINNNTTFINIVKCGNSSCSSGNVTKILQGPGGVSSGYSGSSLAIGADGNPIMAYTTSDANADLMFLHCLDSACSTSSTAILDFAGTTGVGPSLAVAQDGLPVMSYYDSTNSALQYLHCGNLDCSQNNLITTVDNTADQGRRSSIAISKNGTPIISTYDVTFDDLLIFSCATLDCVTATGVRIGDGSQNTGDDTSIAISGDGMPVVSYYNSTRGDLMVFKCYSTTCTGGNNGTSTSVDGFNLSGVNTGQYTSMAIGSEGLPVIAYYNTASNIAMFASCADYGCATTSSFAYSTTTGSNLGSVTSFFNRVYATQFFGKKFQVAAFDVAESYATLDQTLEPGDVVAFDQNNPGYVQRATADSVVMGIVSTKPGLLLSEWDDALANHGQVPVALVGRVPLKVSTVNGEIKVGDRLALSATPGVAALAINGAPSIGIAMDNFNSPEIGYITAFVNLDAGNNTNPGYKALTIDEQNKNIILGSSSTSYGLATYGDLAFLGTTKNTLSFSTTTLLTTQVADFENAKAFILNAQNFAPTSTPDRILFSLRSHDTPVFSVSANGDVNAAGNYYGQSATFGSSTNPGDLAERVDIAADDTVEAGDVMMVDPNSPDTYRRANTSYEGAVAGVISSNPTIVVGRGKTEYTANLAMVGRVPVKVTNENGSIQRGDLLVASSRPGFAMKYDPAKDASSKVVGIIGIALDPLSGDTGKIAALIRTGWVYSQTKSITELQSAVDSLAGQNGENLQVNPGGMGVRSVDGVLTIGQNMSFGGHVLLAVGRIQGANDTWEIDELGNARVKKLTADQIITKQLIVTPDSDPKKAAVGEATILKGQSSVVIENAFFTTTTKIFITFVNNPKHFWWVSKKDSGSFTVSLDAPAEEDEMFDYWLLPTTPVDNLIQPPTSAIAAPESPAGVSEATSNETQVPNEQITATISASSTKTAAVEAVQSMENFVPEEVASTTSGN